MNRPLYIGCHPTEQQEARERLRNLVCGAVIFTAFGSILTTAVSVFLA